MRLGDLDALKTTIINICGKCSNNITEYDENKVPNGNCAIWHILNMIDNAPTVAVNCKDCDGYEAGYTAGVHDAIRPQGECANCVTCDHFGNCEGCEKEEEE